MFGSTERREGDATGGDVAFAGHHSRVGCPRGVLEVNRYLNRIESRLEALVFTELRMLQPIVNLLKPNQTRKQTRSAARGGGVACVRLELAGHLVLEGIELLDELGAGVLVEHVPVHEPGRVSEADELHHLGEDGDGVDGADDGAGEPHERRAAGDVGDHRGLVLGVLPLLIDGDEKVSERKAEGWRRWFRLFFSWGGTKTWREPIGGMWVGLGRLGVPCRRWS